MQEFASVSASSYDPAALVAKQLGLRRKEVFEVDHSFFEQFR